MDLLISNTLFRRKKNDIKFCVEWYPTSASSSSSDSSSSSSSSSSSESTETGTTKSEGDETKESSKDNERYLVPIATYASHEVPIMGGVTLSQPGKVLFVFDNTYSWVNAKSLSYAIGRVVLEEGGHLGSVSDTTTKSETTTK